MIFEVAHGKLQESKSQNLNFLSYNFDFSSHIFVIMTNSFCLFSLLA